MTKKIDALCDQCESNFTLSFDENLVVDYDTLVCPFCNEVIESLIDNDVDGMDFFNDDFLDE